MSEGKARAKRLISAEETAAFCSQISLMLKSGIPLSDGVEALSESYAGTRYAQRFSELSKAMNETGSLEEAVARSGAFDGYLARMIGIGERAGTLEAVSDALCAYYEREASVRAAIRNAVIYPVALIIMMAAVVIVLVASVLPIFRRVFDNLGAELTGSAAAIMNFGYIAGAVVIWLLALLAVAALAIWLLYKFGDKRRVTRLIYRLIPPVRRISEGVSLARVSSVMAMLIESGFPMEESVSLIPALVTNETVRAKVDSVIARMNEGASFPEAAEAAGLFRDIHARMLRVGARAGQIDTVLEKLASIYAGEADDAIRRAVSLIEPTLVAVMSVIIGAVLLSVMLPLASIMSSLG